jgi:hypothetical protein
MRGTLGGRGAARARAFRMSARLSRPSSQAPVAGAFRSAWLELGSSPTRAETSSTQRRIATGLKQRRRLAAMSGGALDDGVQPLGQALIAIEARRRCFEGLVKPDVAGRKLRIADHRLGTATSPVSGTSSSPAMAARSATSTTARRANHGRSPIVRGPRRRAHWAGRGVARAPGAPSSAHRRRRRRHIRLAARSRSASYARPSEGHERRPRAATSSLGPRPRSHGMQAQEHPRQAHPLGLWCPNDFVQAHSALTGAAEPAAAEGMSRACDR